MILEYTNAGARKRPCVRCFCEGFNMKKKSFCLLLLTAVLLFCAACGQTQTVQTENTGNKDQYMTEPVPEGKPNPVEPQDTAVDTTVTHICTFSISCETILDNMDKCVENKKFLVPEDGIVFPATEVEFSEGESVFDVLQRVCRDNAIHMESNWTPMYNSAYVEGINNLYEFDVGSLSGWMYSVNGWYPNYGCSRYQLKDGDVVEWRYTCDLGYDLGSGMGG